MTRMHRKFFPELSGFKRGLDAVCATMPTVSGGDGPFGSSAVDRVAAAQDKRARKAAKRAEQARRAGA